MPSFIWLHAAVVPVIQIKSLVLCFSLHVSVFGLRYQGKTFRNPSFEWGTNAGLSEMRGQFSGVILICRVLGVEGSHSCLAVSSVFNILFFLFLFSFLSEIGIADTIDTDHRYHRCIDLYHRYRCEAVVLPINVIQAIKRSLIYSYTGVGSLPGI